MGYNMKWAVFSVLALAGASIADIQWVNQCASNGFTLIAESDHFEVCKKPTTDDGQANNVSIPNADAQGVLQSLEKVFSFYIDSLGWMLPFPKSPDKKLKSNIYVFDNSVMAALYGGQDYVKGLNNEFGPGMWIGVGSLKDYWGTSHEFAHGLQGVAGWMGNNSHSGWFAESHANWMAHQYNPNDAHCAEYLINYPYLYYGSTRDRYCNWQFLEHLKEEFGGGYKGAHEVNRIWMESIRDGEDGRMEQTPFSAMMMVYGWTLDSLNQQFGKFAMKNATLEYAPAKKALYKKSWGDYEFKTRRDASWGDNYRRHPRVTMLNKIPCPDQAPREGVEEECPDQYISPSYWAPQRWGYNLVRIYPEKAGKVTVKFRGIVQSKPTVSGYTCFGDNTDNYKGKTYKWCNYAPDKLPDPASGWTVGLVAEGADGTPRYSEMKHGTGFNLEIETKDSDKALWLAVTATPTEMQTILWDQFYYSIVRYPYMIEVVNGAPEGYNKDFWKPAGYNGTTASGYAQHSNGGGWVSNKASVASTVYVGPDAVVNGGTISGKVRIEDFAVVNGGTISGNAVVRGRALVTAGTIGDDAVLEEDAWLVSGSITGKAKVGALSIIVNTTVTDNAQVYGVMWALADKKLSGTAQLRGDLENNFTKEISKGVFYGMVNDDMLSNANFGANLTTPPKDATASLDLAQWYAVADDSTGSSDTSTTMLPTLAQKVAPVAPASLQVFDINGQKVGTFRYEGDVQATLRAAGISKGVYLVRTQGSRQARRVLFH